MNIMITGGAGYIGSYLTRFFINSGHRVVVVDNLSTGHEYLIDPRAEFYNIDVRNDFLRKILKDESIDIVIHCAAKSLVGESENYPMAYYDSNVYGTQRLLESMQYAGVRNLVFSSSAAVYGSKHVSKISEIDSLEPVNAYGASKLSSEMLIRAAGRSGTLKYVILRYFNVIGAGLGVGEDHSTETHLVPIVIDAALGKRKYVSIYGSDLETFDGTCERDYVDVGDLARAHILSAKHLLIGGDSDTFNVGSGSGRSVLDVVRTVEVVSGRKVPVVLDEPRAGDPPTLVSDVSRIWEVLKWSPTPGSFNKAIESAWRWHLTGQ